jgi:hypothetical protein
LIVATDREERKARRKQKRRDRKPLGQRIGKQVGDHARAIGELSDVIVNRPGALPGKAHGWFRQWFAKVWRVRGGGLYAFGFAISFAIYEIRMLIDDFSEGSDFGALFDGHIIGFIVDFFIDSLMNTVQAFMWPLEVLEIAPPFGAIALGLAFIAFPRLLKKPIEGWLFGNETEPQLRGEPQDKEEKTP